LPSFLHEYTNNVYGRHICSYGRYIPISTSRGALGGVNNDFNASNYCFLRKKSGMRSCQHTALKYESLPLFWYTLIIFTVYIWKDRHKYWVRIEIDLKFIHTGLYQNELWHGNDYNISHLRRRQTNNIYARWTHGSTS
jgi:hypothetical protein